MTKGEKEFILEKLDKVTIMPGEPLNIYEIKAYIKGFENARDEIFSCVDKCYRDMKTD